MIDLSGLFSPKSIAIYGISENSKKLGSVVFQNILKSGFSGQIYPINPKHSELYSRKCYPDALSISGQVDLAIISLPSTIVETVFNDCIKKQIKNVIIISAGFSEVSEQGRLLEDRIANLAKQNSINLLGPNCLGLIIPESKMNASFAADTALPGKIALISQSGAICTAILDMANKDSMGFSHFVSIGNKPVINENILVEEFLKDENIKVIGAYLEEFENGLELINLKNKLNIEKPIVILAPGKSKEAKGAIQSHTGSITSANEVISAGLSKYGITEVNDVDELYNTLQLFNWFKGSYLKGNIAVVTNAGGVGIITTDTLIANGMKLSQLSEVLREDLKSKLPTEASVKNPIDLIGDADADRYKAALQLTLDSNEVDLIINIVTPQLVTQVEETAKAIIDFSKIYSKPIISIMLGGKRIEPAMQLLKDNEIPVFNNLNEAIIAISHLDNYYIYKDNKVATSQINKAPKTLSIRKYNNELEVLDDQIANQLLGEFQIDTPQTEIITGDIQELYKVYEHFYSKKIVLKALSKDLAHKVDFKAVYINIENKEDVGKYYIELQNNVRNAIGKESSGLLMQEMLVGYAEMFIGIKKDLSFGYSIVIGTGGTYTELYKDFAHDLLPLNSIQIVNLIKKTKFYKLINGFRGSVPLSLDHIVNTILKLQNLVYSYDEIIEVDINPLMVNKDSAKIADIKIYL